MPLHRIWAILVLLAALAGYVYCIKPSKRDCGYQPYFEEMNLALRRDYPGQSAAIIDLDRLDSNIATVRARLGTGFSVRLVAKSLPSPELLEYLMRHAGTRKLMVFSEPFLADILGRWDADTLDILLGKPLPVAAATRLSGLEGWDNVSWLIDTEERLLEYLSFAKDTETQLRIALEIDVGLRRGGFSSPEEMRRAIALMKENPSHLKLTGLMGYDGHVPYVPFYIKKEKATVKAFARAQEAYISFMTELGRHYDESIISGLTFNSGGSRTYFMYPETASITPVNDIALGSGFLCPAEFRELEEEGHLPALFLSSPVLKGLEDALLPNADQLSALVRWWDPNLRHTFFALGGWFAGTPVSPAGIALHPLWAGEGTGVTNLLPNQTAYSSSDSRCLSLGDNVFSAAWEGDGMLSFGQVLLYRSGRVVGRWDTYRGAN